MFTLFQPYWTMGDHKKKKERKRKRSDSSSSSSSSQDGSDDFKKRLKDERKKKKKEKMLEKQRLKEEETPEAKRERRIAKKLEKEQRRKESASLLPDSIDYTNTNNPFNDLNLTKTFVWGKKLDQEGKSNYSTKEVERENRDRIRRNLREMEELKRNREARLAAREDMDLIQRDTDRRSHAEWSRKDMQFQLEQAKVRSRLRIEQNRAKPIDLLARYINFGDNEDDRKEEDDYDVEEPTLYIKNLKEEDYEDLIEDIKVYIAVTGSTYSQWWKDISDVARDELNKCRTAKGDRSSVHTAVNQDVGKIFKGKSLSELETLERQMKSKMEGGGAGTDVSYWSSLLNQLNIHMARKRIRQMHDQKMQDRLRKIRAEQMREMKVEEDEVEVKKVKKVEEKKASASILPPVPRPRKGHTPLEWLENEEIDEQERENRWRDLGEEETERISLELYKRGSYSPTYGRVDDAMPGINVLEEDEDEANLTQERSSKRKTVAGITLGGPSSSSDPDAALKAIAMKGMDKDENVFTSEVQLGECKELWTDKYRPRKPRYLNRVQTGFDWNKYNQTHYDQDNPPPKIVQGYKFNIFYNDLLDPLVAPTFKIFPCDDPEFAEIHFHAGPPYEDIAFKLVNREWEVNYKFGYKCQFQNGVFQLWFQFKRYRYRR